MVYRARYRGADRREYSRTWAKRIDAERWATNEEAKVGNRGWVDPHAGDAPFRDLYESWREQAQGLGKPAASTLGKYAGVWRCHVEPRLGSLPVNGITRRDGENLVTGVREKSSPWQATEALKLARMLANVAVQRDLIVRNPFAGVKTPRTERRELEVLTPAEIDALADAIAPEWRAFVLLGAYSSLRFSELVALRIDRVDFLRRRLRVEEKAVEIAGGLVWGEPKTKGSRRSVALPSVVLDALAEHLLLWPPSADGLIFHGVKGGPIRRPHFGTAWRKACKSAGLEGFRFRNLRHTGATLAIAGGADMKALSGRLGHASIRMAADVYGSLFEGQDRAIADALDAMARDAEAESKRLRPAEQ